MSILAISEKGFDYIYGTGEAASILYAKDSYDLSKEVIKMINDKYKSADKKEDSSPKGEQAKQTPQEKKNRGRGN